jgi:hypothetical protein
MQRDLTVLINGSDDMRDLEKYNPIAVITKIQKTKYKFVMIPIILVIFSFVSEKYIGEEISKNLALIGLISYLLITFLFKINHRYQIAEGAEPQLVFPITGKIIGKEDNYLSIKKAPFSLADVRYSGASFDKDELAGRKYIFLDKDAVVGQLIGVAPFSVTYRIVIPKDKIDNYKLGAKVTAGEVIT